MADNMGYGPAAVGLGLGSGLEGLAQGMMKLKEIDAMRAYHQGMLGYRGDMADAAQARAAAAQQNADTNSQLAGIRAQAVAAGSARDAATGALNKEKLTQGKALGILKQNGGFPPLKYYAPNELPAFLDDVKTGKFDDQQYMGQRAAAVQQKMSQASAPAAGSAAPAAGGSFLGGIPSAIAAHVQAAMSGNAPAGAPPPAPATDWRNYTKKTPNP